MALPGKASFSDYGGEKQDYAAPEDPTTDRSAAEMNPAFADVSAMTRMIPRARLTFTVSAGVCTVTDHDAVWGNGVSVKPGIVYQGAGRYLVSLPVSIVDARGITHTPNMVCGWGSATDSTRYYSIGIRILNGLSFQVLAYDLSSGLDDPDEPIYVWVM